MYLAGGTDLLVNLKHRLQRPQNLISLAAVEGLRGIREDDKNLIIGASVSLHEIASSALISSTIPALATAAGLVAGPQHRHMATIGGNVMLDTRCLFYNQTEEWRRALGWCLKADGDLCHVIGSTKACVAAQSSDTVPVLVALDAAVVARLPGGEVREVRLRELFTKDGRYDEMLTVPRSALVTEIRVPKPSPGHRSVYRKVRARQAIDYPQLGVALVGTFDERECQSLEIVIGAMLPQPRRIKKLERASGRVLDDDLIDDLAHSACRQARPQTQIHGVPDWRRHLVRVEVRRGLQQLRPA